MFPKRCCGGPGSLHHHLGAPPPLLKRQVPFVPPWLWPRGPGTAWGLILPEASLGIDSGDRGPASRRAHA